VVELVQRNRALWGGIAVAVLLLAAVAWSSYRGFQQLAEMRTEVDHTFKVLVSLESLSSSLKDAETGQRGYLLTGKPSYLEPYVTATANLQRDLDNLKKLIGDNPSQLDRLAKLTPLINQKMTEMRSLIDMRAGDGLQPALEVIRSDRGKLLMDQMRAILQQMIDDENRRLSDRSEAAIKAGQEIAFLTSGFAALLMVLMCTIIWLLAREVKARRAAEDDARRTADIFRLLMANVAEYAIIMLDKDGKVVTWNAGAERLKGYTANEITGQHFSIFYPKEDAEKGAPQRELEVAIRDGKFEETAWRVRKDGSRFIANVVVTALRDERGTLQGFLKITRDITDKQRAEEELLRSKQELEILNVELANARDAAQAASKFKSQFVANMSHEIRTPMNGIIGMCNVLLKSGLEERQEGYAIAIKDAGNALLTVINDILDFSKIEAGKIELEIAEFEPLKLVESACEILATQARKKKVSLMSYVDPAMPTRLRGDAERLRQVLLNLTSNAIKFSDAGEIVVSATIESRYGNVCNVNFSVIDQGIGLTDEEKSRLFKPFTQADGSISRKYGGTGLGLSISKSLVELMNGTIGVDSMPGAGSCFWFVVPFEIRSEQPALTVKEELADVRVLIVDDEPNARQILQSYISSWGMRNATADGAEQGLQMLKEAAVDGDPYGVAIVDLVMPAKNGIEMAAEIFKDPALSPTKLVLLTAFDAAGLGTQAIELGFKAYVTKPIRQSQMLDCLVGIVCGGAARQGRDVVRAKSAPLQSRSELILVVEDHPINQQVAELYLDELGFPCHIVNNGEEALEALRKENYALVLMDCQMPVMDGLQATSVIRKNETLTGKHIPIIAMTAHAMQGDRERCIAAGMDDYLTKPLEQPQLRAALQKWLPGAAPIEETNDADDAASQIGTPPLIDLDELDKRYGAKGTQILDLFLKDAPAQIASIGESIQAHDAVATKKTVHALKGVSATVLASEMHEICKCLEQAALNNDWTAMNEWHVRLRTAFENFSAFVRDVKRSRDFN
jgi:polar amino acid transport system substrate-binding protein